jgi:uncharacterized protein (TIGR02265 family)
MADFHEPDWEAPLELDDWLKSVPSEAVTKGMFLSSLVDTVKSTGAPTPPNLRFISFKDYPMHEWLKLAIDCAQTAFPDVQIREGLRRMGQVVYPMFSKTMVGTAIFAVASRDFPGTLRLASLAYRVSIKPGSATVVELSEGRAVVELRNVWSFCDSYQVGIFEGTMQMFDLGGVVRVRQHSICNADLEITWNSA